MRLCIGGSFALQEEGHWSQADALIKRIQDPLLMGHVRFQRLMHPTLYRSSYGELWTWMEAYADHPGARRVHLLAKRRQPKGWKSPRSSGPGRCWYPISSPTRCRRLRGPAPVAAAMPPLTPGTRSSPDHQAVRDIHKRIRRLVSGGYVTKALRFLEQPRQVRLLDAAGFDEEPGVDCQGILLVGQGPQSVEGREARDRAVGGPGSVGLLVGRSGGVAPGTIPRCGEVVPGVGRVEVADAVARVRGRLLGPVARTK